MRTGPTEYTEGLGEVVRGYRLYTGLSVHGFAAKIGMSVRTYERIEFGTPSPRDKAKGRGSQVPPGFFDTLNGIMGEFDDAVDTLITNCAKMPGVVPTVTGTPGDEWARAVACRASMMVPSITPILEPRRAQPRTRTG
jgi:hypothetical protein